MARSVTLQPIVLSKYDKANKAKAMAPAFDVASNMVSEEAEQFKVWTNSLQWHSVSTACDYIVFNFFPFQLLVVSFTEPNKKYSLSANAGSMLLFSCTCAEYIRHKDIQWYGSLL